MKKPETLKNINIGKIIRAEMGRLSLTQEMLAKKLNLEKWIIRDILKQKSIKINKLIDFSYEIGVNFLCVYLQEMPMFANTKSFEDAVIIEIANGQGSVTLSKRSRTADFTQFIHIGKLLKAEANRQKITEETLADKLCCSQDSISRMYGNPDIDTMRLIDTSYALNYDFIRNIYLPYMAVNENEIIANDCISDPCTIKLKPKIISVIKEDKTIIYEKN